MFYISTDLCQIIAFFSVVPTEHVIKIAVIVITIVPVIIVVITIVPVTVIHIVPVVIIITVAVVGLRVDCRLVVEAAVSAVILTAEVRDSAGVDINIHVVLGVVGIELDA